MTIGVLMWMAWVGGVAGDDAADARALMRDVGRRYSEVAALTDTIRTSFAMEGREDERSEILVRIDGDSVEASGIVPPQALTVRSVAGRLALELEGVDGWVVADVHDDPLACAEEVMGIAYPYLPPQLALRWSDDAEGCGLWLSLGLLADVVLVDVERGDRSHELLFRGTAPLLGGRPGECRVSVDASALLVTRIVVDGGTDGLEPTFAMRADVSTRIPESGELGDPIAWPSGEGRRRFDDFQAMLNVALGRGVSVDPTIGVGEPAPAFELVDQHGREHTLAEHLGRHVVLEWWGSWCAPCRRSLPEVQALHERHADRAVDVIGLNVGDDADAMRRFWAAAGYTFPTLAGADDPAEAYGVQAFPSVVVVGPDGRVLHAEAGPASGLGDRLEAWLEGR